MCFSTRLSSSSPSLLFSFLCLPISLSPSLPPAHPLEGQGASSLLIISWHARTSHHAGSCIERSHVLTPVAPWQSTTPSTHAVFFATCSRPALSVGSGERTMLFHTYWRATLTLRRHAYVRFSSHDPVSQIPPSPQHLHLSLSFRLHLLPLHFPFPLLCLPFTLSLLLWSID